MPTFEKKLGVAIVRLRVHVLSKNLGLVKHGVNIQIYEAAKEFCESGGSVGLTPEVIAAIKLISPEICQIITKPVTENESKEDEDTWTTVCYGGKDFADHFITKIKTSDEVKTGQSLVHRYGFLKKLIDLLPAGITHFGKRTMNVYRGILPTDIAKKELDQGKFFNVGLTAHSDQPWDHELWIKHDQVEAMKKDFEKWEPVVGKIVKMMSAEAPSVDMWALYHINTIGKYNKGRVAILRDATHAATPHQSWRSRTILPHDSYHSIINAFRAYDIVRQARSRKLVATSYEAGLLYSFNGPEGDDVEAIKKNSEIRMNWIWEEDPEDQVHRAKQIFGELQAGAELECNRLGGKWL
ncbi:hypothetical protein BDZ45DRAFT_726778 [Acephala macrosclerotiorum]|nr:hypothetical protein BDZ45DRAFT_726778 [Acephala macrosclerotiorum]